MSDHQSRSWNKTELAMQYHELVDLILLAIEAEQDEPEDFKQETELRLVAVFTQLNRMLNLPDDYVPNSP